MIVRDYADRLRADVAALQVVEDEQGELSPALQEQLDLTRAVLAEVDAAIEQNENPTKRKGVATEFLRDERTPERDEVGIVVIQSELGSTLASAPLALGMSGQGASARRWMWEGPSIGFIDRADWAGLRVDTALRNRVVLLDPGRGSGKSWDDLFALVANSPSKVHHISELVRSICRATTSVELLEAWLKRSSKDPQQVRTVRDQLRRVLATAKAAE